MPRKKKELVETSTTLETPIEIVVGITPFEAELGRADLNLLRDKLNEVIAKVNSHV